MEPQNGRMLIYEKDVMLITGKTERTARRLMAKIRKKYNSDRLSRVTLEDFCAYFSLTEGKVSKLLR